MNYRFMGLVFLVFWGQAFDKNEHRKKYGSCVACQKEFLKKEKIIRMGCSKRHEFHKNCLSEDFFKSRPFMCPSLECPPFAIEIYEIEIGKHSWWPNFGVDDEVLNERDTNFVANPN